MITKFSRNIPESLIECVQLRLECKKLSIGRPARVRGCDKLRELGPQMDQC